MRRVLISLCGVILIFCMTGIAFSYTTTYTGTLSDTDFTIWKPPHDTGSALNYVYHVHSFMADMTIDHVFEVFDIDAEDDFTPVIYLYHTSFDPSPGNVTVNLVNDPGEYNISSLIAELTAGMDYYAVTTTSIPVSGVYDLDFRAQIGIVPIPSVVWLLGSGLIVVAGVRKKSRKT